MLWDRGVASIGRCQRTMTIAFHRPQIRLGRLLVAAVVMLVATGGPVAWSQTVRTVKIVVPYVAGGAPDILARLLAQQIRQTRGQAVVVENHPGAGSAVGTELVARAPPDGGTLVMAASSFLINPLLRRLSYDPLTSFAPICSLATVPALIVVNNASPYRTLADLLNAARARPGELTLAGVGPATPYHIAVEMLRRTANVDMTFVPYPGSAPAINALLGDHVTAVFTDHASLAEQLKAGSLRALATGSRTRVESLPDVPTVTESGYQDYEVNIWFGVLAPKETPQETLSGLVGWFTAALRTPEIKAKFAAQGFYPAGICGADFGALLRKQYDDYGRVIREAGIKAE
jgi:tripartite-type tricarboxylate transporter receptor subunit TctC